MKSIKQKPRTPAAAPLPDFRNLGVMLRAMLLVNLLAVLTVLVRVDVPADLMSELLLMAGRVELPLFLAMLTLYGVAPALSKMASRLAALVVAGVALASVALTWPILQGSENGSLVRWMSWALGAALVSLMYFDYRSRLFSPALTEARLQALTARIRPHFLFNTLNAVLGVIRSDPRRAERGLEELAELFRALMRENRNLVPLGEELALCERYLGLEQLRLAERLEVQWQLEGDVAALKRILVPPLLLQPLLENAVYHGVEPLAGTGVVRVRIQRQGRDLLLEVENPAAPGGSHHHGNNMALENIRERLMLFYDLEARLEIDGGADRYRVRIHLPVRMSAE
ncbi:sensor histidine kinase [Parazoarcus communis]|uniref:Sensor histidine kinase n=1 Tax=Parazoarcus communis SWub3 = DSM 12120 TaxID=1121029 RepID=A0A323UQR3_9RHOO|nr:histidine kinase [Parazoarcus communis]NMG72239.1 sensor histidine kinase [Parazoarcus communis SWub3 = DSM 12120]PZA14824.1 sensor histidine kinase [Azoarcus communis] [Parazoarcus communis SWub3 = DSM 12120]